MSCRHRQAEPVVLVTGETVACVCVECFEALPASYVGRQLEKAHVQAFCGHEERIQFRTPGVGVVQEICESCSTDEFMSELVAAMSQAVGNPNGAARVVPITIPRDEG